MKIFVLTQDSDIFCGLRLAGADGRVIENENELAVAVEQVKTDESIGIVMIGKSLSEQFKEVLAELDGIDRLVKVHIPDSGDPFSISNSMNEYIQSTIGIKM